MPVAARRGSPLITSCEDCGREVETITGSKTWCGDCWAKHRRRKPRR
jgi:hypothetical protein